MGSLWAGYRQLLQLEQLNQRMLRNLLIGALLLLGLMLVGYWSNLLTQPVAAQITMGFYSIAAGFFFGYGSRMFLKHRKAGSVLYVHRSFWSDVAPNLLAIILVLFGIYRTGLLSDASFTGIGITSGISLVGFGFFGWTVRIVPEFREKGVFILDKLVEWKDIVSYKWISEEVLEIDYLNDKSVSYFSTYIPPEDQLAIERILGQKIKEHEEERKGS